MRMRKFLFFMIFALSFSGAAWGQTACPQGAIPGSAMCLPDQSVNPGSSEPTQPRWKLTWGAIAMSRGEGLVGTSSGKRSRRQASREAMAKCRSMGGNNCAVVLAYHNQCAVIAWASENGRSIGGSVVVQGAASIEAATALAIPECTAMRGGGECMIVYSDCTAPILLN